MIDNNKLTAAEQAELDELNRSGLTADEQAELDELNGVSSVKKKAVTSPSRLVSGTSVSTEKPSAYAPQSLSKETSVPFVRPRSVSPSPELPKAKSADELVAGADKGFDFKGLSIDPSKMPTTDLSEADILLNQRKEREEFLKPEAVKKADKKILELDDEIVNVSRSLNDVRKSQEVNIKTLQDLKSQIENPSTPEDVKAQLTNVWYKTYDEALLNEGNEKEIKNKAVDLQRSKSTLKKVYEVQQDLEMNRDDNTLKAAGNFLSHVYNATAPSVISGAGAIIESAGDIGAVGPVSTVYESFKKGEGDNKITDIIGDALQDMGKDMKTEINEKYSDKHYISSTIGDITGSILTAALPGGAVSSAGRVASLIASSTASAMQMADDVHTQAKDAGLSDADAGMMTLSVTPLMGLVDAWGAGNIIDNIAGKKMLKELITESVKKLSKGEVTKDVIFKTVGDTFKTVGKKYGINMTKSATEEGFAEGLQAEIEAGSENLYDVVNGTESYGTKIFSAKEQLNVAKQAAIGAVAGGPLGILSGISSPKNIYQKAMSLKDNPSKLAQFQSMLEAEEKAGHITPEQTKNIANNITSMLEADKKIPSQVTDVNKRFQAVELIKEKNNLQTEMMNVDPSMAAPLKSRLNEINSDLELIAQGKERVSMKRAPFESKIQEKAIADIDTQISAAQSSMEGKTETEKKTIQDNINKLTEQKDAIQKQSTGGLLQSKTEGAGETGGKRGTLEQGVEGAEAAKEGEVKPKEVTGPVVSKNSKDLAKILEPSEAKLIKNVYGDNAYNYTNKDGVEVTLREDEDGGEVNGQEVQADVHLDFIGNDSKRGEGLASKELDRIIAEADKNNTSISLVVDSEQAIRGTKSKKGLNNQELKKWYESKGFIFDKNSRYGYRPRINEDASIYKRPEYVAKKNEITTDNLEQHSSPGDLQEAFYQDKLKEGTFHEDGAGDVFKMEGGQLKEVKNVKYVPYEIDKSTNRTVFVDKLLYSELPEKTNIVGEKVKVENAPKGSHLNIGLLDGRTNKLMSHEELLSKLPKGVEVISYKEVPAMEPTLSIETSRPLTDAEMIKLLEDTKQQAIPQIVEGEGILYDNMRGTKDGWGEFNPEYFITQEGKNLKEAAAIKAKPEPLTKSEKAKYDILKSKEKRGKATEADKANIAKYEEKIDKGGIIERTKASVDNVIKALRIISPDTKVELYETTEAFKKAAEDAGAELEVGGFFDPKTKTIHLNLETVQSNTLFHEGVHPILNAIHAIDAKAIDRLFNQVIEAEKRAGKEGEYSKEFASIYKSKGQVEGEITPIQKMEAVTEFIADVADGKIKITERNFDRIKQIFINMMKAVGVDLSGKIKTVRELKKIADKISEGFNKGEEIKLSKKLLSPKDLSIQLQKWGAFEKLGFEETKNFEDLIKSGHIVQDYNLSKMAGSPVFIINPDNMMVGTIKIGEKVIAKGEGGVHFVSNTGDVWAFSDTSRGRTNARLMADFINTQLKEKGVANIVLSKGDLGKLFSSHAGAKGAMRVLEALMDKKIISKIDFRNALKETSLMKDIEGANEEIIKLKADKEKARLKNKKFETEKELRLNNLETNIEKYANNKYDINFSGIKLEDVHADIESQFFNKKDNSFSNRGTFVADVIENLAKNGEFSKEQIKKLREYLNSKELPASSKRKTGNIDFSLKSIKDSIGLLFSDEATVGAKNSDVYAVIRVENPEFRVEMVKGEHESYGSHVRQVVDNIPLDEFLKKYKNLKKEDLLINNKNEVVGIRPKLLLLSEKSHIADVINDSDNKPTGATQLGSNTIGIAEGFVKDEPRVQMQKPRKVDLVEKAGKRKEMTEDDKGNYLFFHYSDAKFNKLNPEKVGKHLATSRGETPAKKMSMLYTRPDRLEPGVPSQNGYVVRVPKDKVYHFNTDPLNLLPEAEKLFRKENGKDKSFDLNNQVAYVAKVAAEKGFPVTTSDWNIKGTKALRAQTTEGLPVEKYSNIKPGTTNQIQFNPEFENVKPNAKRRDIQYSMEGESLETALDRALETAKNSSISKGLAEFKESEYFKKQDKEIQAELEDYFKEEAGPVEKGGLEDKFDALDDIANKLKEPLTKSEINELTSKRKAIFDENPEVKEINDNFSKITRQLEEKGDLKKSRPDCP